MSAVYAAACRQLRRLSAACVIISLSGAKCATHLRSGLRKIQCSGEWCFRVCLRILSITSKTNSFRGGNDLLAQMLLFPGQLSCRITQYCKRCRFSREVFRWMSINVSRLFSRGRVRSGREWAEIFMNKYRLAAKLIGKHQVH